MDEDAKLPKKARPEHLLWTLLFMKLYSAENVLAPMCGCDEKTFRKWVRLMMAAIGSLDDVVRTLSVCVRSTVHLTTIDSLIN